MVIKEKPVMKSILFCLLALVAVTHFEPVKAAEILIIFLAVVVIGENAPHKVLKETKSKPLRLNVTRNGITLRNLPTTKLR
jgi:hypothetical protein